MKPAKFIAAAILMMGVMAVTHSFADAQTAPAASSAALPPKWDPKIPLPPGATLISSTAPKMGVVYSADFMVAGNYKDLVDFYERELPKAGFGLSSKVAMPARKVYNRNFVRAGMLDSVVISPSTSDPSKFSVHIAWSPEPAQPKASAS
ncbi:MAG TPA: hypothetical protein VKV03_12630 [Candidatus Binataceae bacterium]|nr:hypothetical protein [Candidatus Binataceae bacterium]